MKSTLLSLTTLLTLTIRQVTAAGMVHIVTVGDDGSLKFGPDSLMADTGDVVQFQIYPTHSIAQSTFSDPCQPISSDSLWTGFSSDKNTYFTITVNDTSPMWLYCGTPGHCQAGMAMVINPPSGGNTIAAYQSASSSANTDHPANIAGGVFGKGAAAAVSSSMMSSMSAASSSMMAMSTAAASSMASMSMSMAAASSMASMSMTAASSAAVASASAGSGAKGLVADALLVAGAVVGGAAFLV